MQEGWKERKLQCVCAITEAGINSSINLSGISLFPPLHLLLPVSLLSPSAADFTAVSNYSALNISTHFHCSSSGTPHLCFFYLSQPSTPLGICCSGSPIDSKKKKKDFVKHENLRLGGDIYAK